MNQLNEFDFAVCENSSCDKSRNDCFDFDKENTLSKETDNLKFRSSRKSILRCLDPLNPYESPVVNEESVTDKLIEKSDTNEKRKLNESRNLMLLDYDDNNELESIDNYDRSRLNDTFNLLELSENELREENNVAVESLLPITPMKKFVEKSTYDKLTKYHDKKEKDWIEKETKYLVQIDQLKSKYNSLKENEKVHKTLIEEKESLINDLLRENEENLEKLRLMINTKQEEIDESKKEIETLRQEIVSLASFKMNLQFVVDQYSDALEELIEQHRINLADLNHDNESMLSMLNKYLSKINSSSEIISIQKQNQEVLLQQLSINEEKLRQLDKEQNNYLNDLESKLKKKDVQLSMLENTENNLRMELELRTKERDQLKENLTKMLE